MGNVTPFRSLDHDSGRTYGRTCKHQLRARSLTEHRRSRRRAVGGRDEDERAPPPTCRRDGTARRRICRRASRSDRRRRDASRCSVSIVASERGVVRRGIDRRAGGSSVDDDIRPWATGRSGRHRHTGDAAVGDHVGDARQDRSHPSCRGPWHPGRALETLRRTTSGNGSHHASTPCRSGCNHARVRVARRRRDDERREDADRVGERFNARAETHRDSGTPPRCPARWRSVAAPAAQIAHGVEVDPFGLPKAHEQRGGEQLRHTADAKAR